MMKITKLSLCVSMAGLLATLPAAYANEIVTNCTQVSAVDGGDANATNNESCAKLLIPFDFGDAPDPSFPTLDASGGARHQLGTDVFLGKCIDADTGLLQGTASADDADKGSLEFGTCTDPASGDEDGVAIAPLHVGDTQNVVQVTANAACKLNAWVDWNHDGSWGGAGEQIFIDKVLAAGRNDLTMDVPAFAAEGTIYTRFRCSTAGADGIGGEAADGEVEDYALNILAAIPKTPVSVGDIIWEDTNKDGKQTEGENPLAGAMVSLLDSTGAPAKDLSGTIVAEITTDATGKYLFGNLPEGDYSVKITPPKDYIPTLNAGDVDNVPANDDSNCAVQGDGSITSALFSLTADGEPVDDGDADANSNLSVDCGFYKPTEPVHSLGNKVWIDDGAGTDANANNGTLDAGEVVVDDGVVVELRDAAGVLLTSTTTSNGFYLFSGLTAGDYKVCVANSNFATGAMLDGFSPSTGGNEMDTNAGIDSNDNGSDVLADGLCSNVITLDGDAPTGEIDTANGAAGEDGVGTPDALSDLTVDFAVVRPKPPKPVSVGDYVWIDANEDGQQDKDELPLVGAVVTLLDKDGNPVKDLAGNPVDYLQTGIDGKYLFSNLPEGEYIVRVKAPDGYVATQGGAAVDTDPSNTDSNCAVTGSNVQTLPFMLTAGAESTKDGDTDASSDLSVDCGFYVPKVPVHSVGNRVWVDANNDGLAGDGEVPAVAGIKLELKDAAGAAITATTTDAEGRYLFSNLAAGSYQVCVVADNFSTTGVLNGFTASTGGNVADANTDVDGDDNGTDDITTGLCSNLVVLDDKELTGEAGANGQPGVDGMGTDDNRSNLSVDFGIVPPVAATPVAVGDYLWIDTNENGLQDAGETGLAGATVTLLDTAGSPAKDVQGNVVAPMTTGADGLYGFTKLPEGDYMISVKLPDGSTFIPTQNAGDVDEVPANNDSNCAVQGDGSITSTIFTLNAGQEPAAAADGDSADNNMTVDCGFYEPKQPVHSIGNMVWADNSAGDATKDNNGTFDAGETLLSGVKVELRDKAGVVIDSTMTTDGYYLFAGMAAGEYQVCVAASNFSGMGKLVKYTAGITGNEADANADIDDNDNGDTTTVDGLCSNVVVIDDKEPTAEATTASGTAGDDSAGTADNRSNLTVDFAVLAPVKSTPKPVSVGDMIWIDANEDGKQNETEAPLAGATVTLLDKDGKPVLDLAGNEVKPVTTGADGKYVFIDLPEGDYSISVAAPTDSGYLPTKGGADVDEDASNTDSNCAVSGSSVQTALFTLTAGGEPIDDGDTDASSNFSVDCGFYLPKVPVHSLGNRVWVDTNNNGVADAGEVPAAEGVKLELQDATGKTLDTTTTNIDGRYLFGGLAAGSYQVCVVADNFLAGNVLEGFSASTGGDLAAAIASNTDGDDNGNDDISKGLCSNVVVLDDKQPLGEAGAGAPGEDGIGTDDARSNLTIDFGIVPPTVAPKTVSVGNVVWEDTNADGKQDAAEPILAGVEVTLLDSTGTVVKTMLTDATGNYLFTDLPEGDYSITVQAPAGYEFTAQGTEATANDDSNCSVAGAISLFNLTAGAESITDGDTDANSDLTQDCGLVKSTVAPTPVAIGDYLWIDTNANGLQDAGETGLAGATVTLLDTAGSPVKDLQGNVVAPMTTGADGLYGFTKLPEGDYMISVKLPDGSTYIPTQNAGDVDDVPANNDSNCAVQGDGSIASAIFTLNAGQEPAAAEDGDSADKNMTVDCGFYEPTQPMHSIGNMVWVDNSAGDATKDNNGKFDAGETLLSGIKVELRDKAGAYISNTMTTDGYYLFAGLAAGEYQVCVVADNFKNMGKLVKYTAGITGNEADANADIDDNDNGDTTTVDGLCSNVVVLDDKEPTAEATTASGTAGDDGAGTADNRSNLTVDFAVLAPLVTVKPKPVSVGDMIWIDTNENGQQDKDEAALAGATVTLLDKDGKPVVDLAGNAVKPVTTGDDGKYVFIDLPEGDYSISVAAPADSGYLPTKGGADVDTDASNTDSNCAVSGSSVQTGLFTLTADGEPIDDGDTDASSNLSVDCGFYLPKEPVHSLGNRVWIDANNNGVADVGEVPAMEGIKLELQDANGKMLDATTTNIDGRYLFSGLAAGSYQVCVVADNFAAGNILEGFNASTGGDLAAAIASNTDGDDNGTDDISKGLCSNVVVLDDKQPLGEAGVGAPGEDGIGTDDARSNLTIDFGIVPPAAPLKPVSVGNYLWIDANEDGIQDKTESALAGATVTLLDAKGEPAKHLDGAAVDAIITGTDGQYLFDNLPAGDYSITVLPPEGGYVVTKGGTDADTDESNTDSNCSVVGTGIQTALFTLTPDAEPVDDGDTDASSNLSVDCGFYVPKVPVHSIGNMVWVDDGAGDATKANDGVRDAKELAVPDGVVMELLGKDGKVISEVPTKDGYYLFSGLEAGEYSVCVAHGNFDQGLLKGYTASTGGDEKDITAGVDNSDNGENDTQDGLCSDVIVLDDKQPTGELPTASGTAGDDGMKTDDNRSNLTIDFGVLPPAPVKPNTVSVGDYIWIDTNKDGQQDADETGLAGATVTLMDKDGKPVVLDGTTLMPVVTGADGKYVFSNLPEGEYSISVAAPKDSAYLPTQGGAKVDSDPSNTDSNCSVDTGKTSLFTLTAGAEPDTTADGDGLDGNMTVDCGFYLPVAAKASISGTVSVDTTGDSVGETPLAGISLALLNKDGTPVLDKDGKPVTTLTDAKGEYVFTDVAAGDYLVVETQPADYTSVMDGDTTSPEDDTADTDTTDDSIPVTVTAGETDDRNDFVERAPVKPNTVSVGDYIWIDANENGQQDAGEAPLAGATVTLMDKDGKPVVLSGDMAIAPIVTGADGKYVFSNLPEGEYSISVAAPKDSGYLPTQGGAKVDTDPSNTDSNCSVDTGKTSLFTLTAGAEPDATADGDSTDGNMTVDCGFYLPKKPMHSIGNMVWVDNGEGTKASNGKYDQGETLPSAVQVELRDATGTLIRSTQTDKGFYLFNELEAGAYKVCVAGSNFNEGAVLAGYTASDIADETDANDGGDNNDNGDNTASDGLCSNLIVLDDKEPKGETPTASGTAGDDGMATDDNRSNLTVDFAVVPVEPVNPGTPVSVGNQIWVDSNADGKRDEGESLLAGAVVTLTDGSGRAVTDLDGAAVASHTTGNDGLYVFSNLPEGEYIVTVEPPEGFFPTVGGIDADTDASDFDSNCRVNPINTTIETHPFTLTAGAEPDADGDDTNGNMTVDCGFYGSVSLGNKIWQDDNANGQQDNAEPGIAGITINLMEEDGITPATDISGNVVAGVKTDASGNYLFENLKPGNYIVVVNPGKDSGYSLTKGGADPDADTSNTDSNCKVVAGTFQTPAVTLLPGSEPAAKVDGDDESRNSTVDCGLFRPVNLGSRLWIDLDNNGKQDGGEPGVPGATVTLLTVDGKPVTDIFGDVLKPQTTDADGKYFFGSLREGQYVVKVIPPAGYLPTVAVIDPNNNDGTDSNGVLNADGSIVSKPIDLKWGDEPADGGATNTTVGFGLIANLHVPTLSQWGVAIMSMLLATAAFFRRRRED